MKGALKSRMPMQVLRYSTLTVIHYIIFPENAYPTSDVDANRNPHLVTKERIERAAAENQFIKGKLAAIEVSEDGFLQF